MEVTRSYNFLASPNLSNSPPYGKSDPLVTTPMVFQTSGSDDVSSICWTTFRSLGSLLSPQKSSCNPYISSDIMLRIIASMVIIPGGMGPLGVSGNSCVERLVEAVFLQKLDSGACCVYVRGSFAAGVFPDIERGCSGATGLLCCHCGQLASQGLILGTNAFHLRLLGIVLMGLFYNGSTCYSQLSDMAAL
ncbi:hypothetical protein TIFTF001_036196 [Ficus carica]|uniref:Uncharacterized protein n=1 Tax=Ficus carica TaxID=3494 RepID=A0AA88E3S6_FICCA|nr:hypothetical protein TIFTF001_036196 [Ficus carica]